MTSITNIDLNLSQVNCAVVVYAKQNDKLARHIAATLYDGATAWTPPAGSHPIIRFLKPDGTSGFYDVDENNNAATTISGNVATMTIVEQALTVPGDVYMELNFYNSAGEKLTTLKWLLRVQQSVLEDSTIISSDYYNVLTAEIAAALAATGHPPYINSTTKNWMIWDTGTNAYVDSGYSSVGLTYYYTPSVSAAGDISWTNNGNLPNPTTQNIKGPQGVSISSTSLVGSTSGVPGTTDTYDVNLSNGNVAGQFTVYNGNDGSASMGSQLPLMDGTASVGSANAASREDHVHPHDSLIVRKNLLDNWYFVGGGSQQGYGIFPINQRGQTIYSSIGYGIDRWTRTSGTAGTVELKSTGCQFYSDGSNWNSFRQYVNSPQELLGKKVTLSALSADNSFGTVTTTVPSSFSASDTSIASVQLISGYYIMLRINTTFIEVRISSPNNSANSPTLAAIKLELGDTQTLAHLEGSTWVLNEIPNYQEELLKCMAYYQQIGTFNNWKFYDAVVRATGSDGIICLMAIPIVPMRATPTVTTSSSEIQMVDYPGGSSTGVNTIGSVFEVGYSRGDGLINIQFNVSNSLTVGYKGYAFIGSNGSGHINLAADL